MWETITNFISGHLVLSTTVAASISGFILKKTGVLKWIRDKAAAIGESLFKFGFNVGVVITTKGNELPFFGIFYEHAIEPVLAMVLEVIPGVIFKFCSGITDGMKSDNKALKK